MVKNSIPLEQEKKQKIDPNNLLLRNYMDKICKTGIVKWKSNKEGTKSIPIYEKGKNLGLCQWDHTIGQPIPKLNAEQTDKGDFKYKTTTLWKILVVVEIILLILSDWNPIFWFNPAANLTLDILMIICIMVMHKPWLGLIGILEIIPEFTYPSMYNFVELIPIHTILVIIGFSMRSSSWNTAKKDIKNTWESNVEIQEQYRKKARGIKDPKKLFYADLFRTHYPSEININIPSKITSPLAKNNISTTMSKNQVRRLLH